MNQNTDNRPGDEREKVPSEGNAEPCGERPFSAPVLPERRLPDRRDRIFFLVAALGCFLFFNAALGGGLAFGATVYFWLLFFMTGFYLRPWQGGAFPLICGALGLILSLGFSFSADRTVAFFSLFGTELLYLLFAGGIAGALRHGTDTLSVLRDTSRIFFMESVSEAGVIFRGASRTRDGGKLLRTVLKVVLGVLFALPVLMIVVPLLIRADGAFSAFLARLPEFSFGRTAWHLLSALLLTPFATGMLFSLKYRKKEKNAELSPEASDFRPPRGLDPIVFSGFLGVLSVCYLLYLFSQLGYFFSAFAGEIPESVRSASSYARRGFGEMCGVSAINLLAVFLTVAKMRRGAKGSKAAGALACFVSVFSLVLIATALSKMILYIRFYGMLHLRILTSLFMLILALCFLLAILRVFRPKFPYLRILAVFSACILIAVSYMDIGAFTADYNVRAYLNEDSPWHLSTVDLDYLTSDIGLEAAPALLRLYREAKDPSVQEAAGRKLESLRRYSEQLEPMDWRSFLVSRSRALRALRSFSE